MDPPHEEPVPSSRLSPNRTPSTPQPSLPRIRFRPSPASLAFIAYCVPKTLQAFAFRKLFEGAVKRFRRVAGDLEDGERVEVEVEGAPMSIEAAAFLSLVKDQADGTIWTPIPVQRRLANTLGKVVPVSSTTRVVPTTIAGVPSEWIIPQGVDPNRTLLFLHGGAYYAGGRKSHRGIADRLAQASGCRVLLPEYRKSPEFPLSASQEDSLSVYRWLTDPNGGNVDPRRIALMGESAGGGIAMSTLCAIRDAEQPLPAVALLVSPWTDLSCSGASMREGAERVDVLDPDLIRRAASVLTDTPRDPRLSPVFADLRGITCPLFISVGSKECLHDDSMRLANRLREAGCSVVLHEAPNMFHGSYAFSDFIPESRASVEMMGRLVRDFTRGSTLVLRRGETMSCREERQGS